MPEELPLHPPPSKKPKKPLGAHINHSVRATMLAGLSALGCIELPPASQPPHPIPTYEEQKHSEAALYEPTEAEIQYFLDIFAPDNLHEFINDEEKVWLSEKSKYELAGALARLAKTMELEKSSFKNAFKKIVGGTKIVLHTQHGGDSLYGSSGRDIDIYPVALEYASEVIFHELIHSFHDAYTHRLRHKNPFTDAYSLYQEGATQLATKIAFPNTCLTGYTPGMILTAALGKDFYRLQFYDTFEFNESIAYNTLGKDPRIASRKMEKYILAFASGWKISDPHDLNELKNILGFPEFKNPPGEPEKKNVDLEQWEDDFKKQYEKIVRLKKLLKKYNVEWKHFLESISPPSNNFAKDWTIFFANRNNKKALERWQMLKNCPK